MFEFFAFFSNMWSSIVDLLDSYTFDFGGVQVGIFTIILGIIGLTFIVGVFWRGAKK